MFNIESYVTPILLSYVDKYVRDFKPADAQVSLWGGGVTLHNLVLKADVLQQEVALPFTLVSGRIHELLIQVPWTKIMSEPIVVTINTIECILSLNPPPDDSPQQETHSSRTQVVEAPPGYMQALVRRIVSNIAVRVHSLIVKYVHDDIVMSLNVKHLAIDSVGPNWEPAFADIDQNQPAIRRLVRLDDLTLCLDKSDSDGKIRFFHEPLLYRCQLDLRVLTRLISANTRRARSLSVQLLSSRLAWGVNNEQLLLLLRLIRERTPVEVKSPPPVAKQSNVQVMPMNAASSNSAEPTRTESWSEWAWSWLPTLDSEGVEETPAPATPVPVAFTAHFDHVSLVFKIMELEAANRKRARGILELMATDAVIKSSMCSPTLLRVKLGTRLLTLSSHGKCVCGVLDASVRLDQPTIYLKKIASDNEEPWSWVEEELIEQVVETAVAIDEEFKGPNEGSPETTERPKVDTSQRDTEAHEDVDEFWQKMAPVIYFEYNHDRSPSDALTNPYDNPPRDFEYSDWLEDSSLKVKLRPISIDISTGLIHRLAVLKNVLKELPVLEEPEVPMRTLTVEECDALSENLPLRHTNIDISGLKIQIVPSKHTSDHKTKSPLVLDIQLPNASISITSPLYPHRVCSAACQMLDDSGALWQGARLHLSANIESLQAGICSSEEDSPRACARANVHFVTHSLLNSALFKRAESVLFGYTLTIREANLCGSAARLQAAYHVLQSLINEKLAIPLQHTTLAKDALSDEESVAIDVTLEGLSLRGYVTKNINTHFITLNSAKATAFHHPIGGELKQAWLFSAPEAPNSTPYLRTAVQWCKAPNPSCLEFVNVTVEPTALSVDPLLVAWLGYRPKLKPVTDSVPRIPSVKTTPSTPYLSRRRTTPPSSSGRGGSRSGSATELVHVRPRSVESSSERSEKNEPKRTPKATPVTESWWSGDNLLKLHERLNRLLLTAEVGLIQIYVTSTSVSALDCVSVRDAMERHATTAHRVFVVNLGRLSMHSNSQTKHLWQEVRSDRPTYQRRDPNAKEDSFPWKTRLADVSCYTLQVRVGTERSGRDKSAPGIKSQLKASRMVLPTTVLDMVTTTITLSVVTKSLQIKSFKKPEAKPKHTENKEEDRTKYFTSGIDFKPSSLKEFIRGPIRRKKNSPEPEIPVPSPEPAVAQTTVKTGPVVSLGVYLHADTPPIKLRLDQDQVQTVAIAIHCFNHVLNLLRRPPVTPKQTFSSFGSSHRSLVRSVSELEARQSLSEETPSENHSEQLISIFEADHALELDTKLKTFFWFQWVVSRATLIVTSPQVKVAFDVDDIITTVDLQNHYNQLKVKVASASVKHYKRTGSGEWSPGALGGRILEVREPANAKEENHFLAITVTQARISNLPASWKELYSKLLEQNTNVDSMWEVYATLAPLEAVLQPDILDHAVSWLHELTPQAFCSLNTEETRPTQWQWPFLYVVAGGLRLLLTNGEEKESASDDTLMLVVGKVTVNPHPENPICRQSVNATAESTWTSSGTGLEGQQYEVLASQISIRSAQFSQLVSEEVTESEILKGTGGENPALKWSQPVVSPIITPVLHPVDVGCILAPAIYSCGAVASGPAIELNLLSDCSLELAVERLQLVQSLTSSLLYVFRYRPESSFLLEEDVTCPYAALLSNQDIPDPSPTESETTINEEAQKATIEMNRNLMFDSGVETATSQSTFKVRRDSAPIKKSVSIVCVDYTAKASDYLEVFITMGVIDLSLYVGDDNSPEVQQLKPPPGIYKVASEPKIKVIIDESKENKDDGKDSMTASRSLTETIRNVDIGKTKLEQLQVLPLARKTEGNVALLHATLHQPNLYYWKRKKQKTFQVSLFNAWIGLGVGLGEGHWNAPLFSTTRGTPDPVTDIPPALATLRIDLSTGYVPMSGSSGLGTVQLDIERPVLFEVCMDRLRRLKGIMALINKNISKPEVNIAGNMDRPTPLLYKIKRSMVKNQIESITIQTNQIGVRGSEGALGWEGLLVQSAAGLRPDRVNCRALLTAVSVSAGPTSDRRHVVLQPAMMGGIIDATWEAWRRAESGLSAREPTVRVGLDLDHVILDLRPCDLVALVKIQNLLKDTFGLGDIMPTPETPDSSTEYMNTQSSGVSNTTSFFTKQCSSSDTSDPTHHYYKDDLRSGAFKIVSGCQLPMAYQVTLHGNSVSWRYPHPRAITRLIAYPIPGQDEEVECALELYCPMLARWEPHTYFKLPVSDPREMQLNLVPHDSVFASMWRIRVCSDVEQENLAFEFDSRKFMPRQDPLSTEPTIPSDYYKKCCNVTAEQLSGVLRVDSYFAPRLMPRARLALRMAVLEIHAHNSLPVLSKQTTTLEGYYVSRPLMRSHRVLTLRVRDSAVHCVVAASTRLLLDTHLSSDIIDSATGTMEQLIEEFRIQSSLSLFPEPRVRARVGDVRVALHVPRVSTLRSLLGDWTCAYKYSRELKSGTQNIEKAEMVDAATALCGRVSLWVHNECAGALRIGQEGTEELIPFSAGASLAYRWRSPTAPKKLRFALASPSADWHWSTSIPFTEGKYRVRLEDGEMSSGGGMFVHVRVRDGGARRDMYLSGRLVLANMLRHNLLYKVRARCSEKNMWQTISSGELHAESVGLSVICNCECEAVLKVKFTSNETGWSGDIPLKECRKENVPWLVKVPSEGEVSYTSIWCRVVRARHDNSIIATTWPFYVLRSHLPLDVQISSETGVQTPQTSDLRPIVQTANGRGAVTHLIAPGTTAARHMLTFQYKNIECPVTREAVPLHYGVTDTSVFDKPASVNNIEEIVDVIQKWLVQSGREAKTHWPYSIVTNHWPGIWQPALLQPRCDVTIRYRAIRAGGGCSLELQLSPVVLLANASPVTLTLRGHDAAPLCRLEPGVAISPPTAVLEKPFFMSVEIGRETFVSGQLRVCEREPGRYESPPPGHLALDRAANFAVQCNQKVALLTMYYEIKEDINILGITSTYILINRLSTHILVSAVAVPNEIDKNTVLQPKTFKVIQPTRDGSLDGTPLCRFWMSGRWRGGDADELRTFLCLALPSNTYPATTPVPIRLGTPPIRRAIALMDCDGRSIPIIITQVHHEARWIITVAPDPCPQFVVHNRTKTPLAVAQPITDETTLKSVQVVQECPGIKWWCVVKKNCVTHYSTPAHCARYPPPAHATRPPLPFLTVGHCRDETLYEWCQPIAVADGEQLLQLPRGVTIKVRVRTHPHSTLIELLDVDQHDISASDIRRRLLGAFSEGSSQSLDEHDISASDIRRRLLGAFSEGSSQSLDEKNNDVENVLPKVSSDINLATDPLSTTQKRLEVAEATPLLPVKSTTELPSQEPQTLQGNRKDTDKRVGLSGEMVITTAVQPSAQRDNSSLMKLSSMVRADIADWSDGNEVWPEKERVRCVIESIAITIGASADVLPLIAAHLQRAAALVLSDTRKIRTTVSVADVQIDNAQYETEQYDFAVVATTRAETQVKERWPPLWGMFNEVFSVRSNEARLLLRTCHDKWAAHDCIYQELTEIELKLGPLGLYIEDAYVGAAVELYRLAAPLTAQTSEVVAITEISNLQNPLRLRKLHIHPLDLTLTLHTAVRMYIALDESPLRLSAFQLQDVMTSSERLTHALTVHYLSAAILGAGWVVGGLELLGAPGALASRVGSAGGGVRGVASAAAGALLRSLSAAAGSLARNLDLLAGDDDHARRAAAARRRPPPSLMAGLVAGITNFAINILGAVGGLAHHPLVGVAVGESGSGAAALRRGLVGAITKPLSATADLVAYAGHGLLTQTGWDPVPQPKAGTVRSLSEPSASGWRRDCVRWGFRLAELNALAGFAALLDDAPLHLLLTHKFLVIADPETERVVEMIDFKFCTLGPYQGQIIELVVTQKRASKVSESRDVADEDNEFQISAAAMARVARYTGAAGYSGGAGARRVLALLPAPGTAHALHAALHAALHCNDNSYFPLL
ncbi:unnamed protein product, partial [Brenthis ino]